jgi:hypothetical protein
VPTYAKVSTYPMVLWINSRGFSVIANVFCNSDPVESDLCKRAKGFYGKGAHHDRYRRPKWRSNDRVGWGEVEGEHEARLYPRAIRGDIDIAISLACARESTH